VAGGDTNGSPQMAIERNPRLMSMVSSAQGGQESRQRYDGRQSARKRARQSTGGVVFSKHYAGRFDTATFCNADAR